MHILIVSDSHGKTGEIKRAIEKSGPFDMLIHLGDIEDDTQKIREWAGCPCYFVSGNCDYDYKLQDCQIINLPPHRIFAVLIPSGWSWRQKKCIAISHCSDIRMFRTVMNHRK